MYPEESRRGIHEVVQCVTARVVRNEYPSLSVGLASDRRSGDPFRHSTRRHG